MQSGIGSLLSLIVLGLMHWQVVDMWFSRKGGLKWFWGAPSPSLALKLARTSFIAMLVVVGLFTSLDWSSALLALGLVLIFGHLGLLVYVSERPK